MAVGSGRPIKYFTKDGVIREGLRKEGISAFFTPTKYFSRVLMNCPAQGTIPWFYNSILPIFEPTVIKELNLFIVIKMVSEDSAKKRKEKREKRKEEERRR